MEKVQKEILYRRLSGADKILIQDYDNYCPYKACNGGQYLFESEYTKIGDNKFEEEHYTSAEFDYCPIYGTFTSCESCPDYDIDKGCMAKPDIVNLDEIIDYILRSIDKNIQVFAWFGEKKELIVTCDTHQPGYCTLCNDNFEEGSYIVEEN